VDRSPETEQGKAIFQELLWVHGAIRRDLATVEELAAEVLAGLPAEEARERVEELKTNGPLWRLKVNCLRYCRFVHSHHNAEDALFFPTLRAANPGLAPVVDKLEADHRTVSDLLDEVEVAAGDLDGDDATRAPRGRARRARRRAARPPRLRGARGGADDPAPGGTGPAVGRPGSGTPSR
jgi:Hemerythrin HHE cation binding domain